jgi:hypothetical protein
MVTVMALLALPWRTTMSKRESREQCISYIKELEERGLGRKTILAKVKHKWPHHGTNEGLCYDLLDSKDKVLRDAGQSELEELFAEIIRDKPWLLNSPVGLRDEVLARGFRCYREDYYPWQAREKKRKQKKGS